MALLEALYKEIIFEHYKRPHNYGELHPHSHRQEGVNPGCGDELTLFLNLEGDKVAGVSFTGEGCAISLASASLMTEAIKGKSVTEALALAAQFKAMIHGAPPATELGDLKLLQGISKLHARVKCAALAWVTLEQAVKP